MSNLERNRLFVAALTVCLCLLPFAGFAQQGWGTPASLGPARGAPAAAIDHLGNIVAVWTVNADTGVVLQARRYARATETWSAPVIISMPAAGDASEVRVVMDAAGNATAAWVAGGIHLARYVAAADTWSPPAEIANQGPCSLGALRGVNDRAGSVFLTWRSACRQFPSSAFASIIHAARYDAADGSVVAATLTGAPIPGFVSPDLVADATGNAMVVWPERGVEVVIKAAQYSAAARSWGGATTLFRDPGGATVEGLNAGIDALGNITLLWSVVTDAASPPGAYNAVRAARFDQGSRTWSPVAELTRSADPLWETELAVDASGNALAVWTRHESAGRRAQAALYDAGSGVWGPVVDLSPPGVPTHTPQPAVDGFGNLTVVWQQLDLIHAARRTAAGVISTTTLARADDPIVSLAAGAAGHVAVLWRSGATPDTLGMNVVEWRATPTPPRIETITPGDGRLTVSVTPPVMDEPAFAPLAYDYSIDDGATWTRDGSGLLVSPVRITGLSNGVTYPVRVRAVNHAGAGAASPVVLASPQPSPSAPAALTVVLQRGRLVMLQWTPTPGVVPATGYVVEGGVLPGQVQASLVVSSGLPTFTFEAPPGAYYLRVHAVAGAVWSAPSNEVRIFVERAIPPSRPLELRSVVNGSTVDLSWRNTFTGGAPTGVVLSVSGALSTSIRLPVVESFRVAGVPPGAYTVRVSAVNDAGESVAPVGVSLQVPASCAEPPQGPPAVPTQFTAATSGAAYHLAWAPPIDGPAVERYEVRVAGAFTGSLITAERFLTGVAAPGTYAISVAAMNACGVGPATAPVTIVLR